MFIVYDENMNIKPFPQGVTPLDIFISSINRKRVKEETEGVHGYVDKGYTYDTRNINVILRSEANDTRDYRLLRDEVFSFFSEHDYLYISEEYQRGKRYKVTAVESFIPERINRRISSVGIAIEMADLPFAESIGTTQDIQLKGINADDELWGFGMGLIDNEDMVYKFVNNQSPRVFNAGNVRIHPFKQEFKLKLIAKSDSMNNGNPVSRMRIYNRTTDEYFQVDDYVKSGDVIEIDGPVVKINGLNALHKTSKDWFTLAPGFNDFTIYYLTDFELTFDFRFYYL
ncbi:phage tail domain-containing protein [Psychrobacillus sp.]|uniref:phage tail domain-containing protein n=1 Tax=Psychrobacillus sp. TaxID=1871623 RepID=UPI0028BEAC3D|nr:phage tail domain-containing protein [Psychrobacillus sp.]